MMILGRPGGWGDLDDVTLKNLNGSITSIIDRDGMDSRMNSISDKWVAEGRHRLRILLQYLDRKYPGRISGVFFTMLQTGRSLSLIFHSFSLVFTPFSLIFHSLSGEFDYPITSNEAPETTGFTADYSEQVRESFCARYPSAISSTMRYPSKNW